MASAVAVVLLLATYVRLSYPDLSWFGIDQARDAQVALGIVAGRSFPLLGVEVAGGPAHTWGPAYFYLLAIPFALSRDPALAVAFLSAMSVAGLLVTYRLCILFFGRAVAVLSVALLGTYPLAVLEAKALWNVAPMTLFTAVFFHAMFSVVVQRRSVMIIPALTALGVLLQFHLSAIALIVVLVLALVLFRPPLRARHLAVGGALLLALMLPYLVTQWLTGFQDIRAAAAAANAPWQLRGPVELAELTLRVLFASPDVVSGLPALRETWRPGIVLGLHQLEAGSLVIGLVFVGLTAVWPFLARRSSDDAHRSVVLVALGCAIPFAMLGARGDVRPHYFDVTYPMPFIAAAVTVTRGVEWIGRLTGRRTRGALWSAIGVAMAATVISQVDLHRHLWRTISTTGAIVWTRGGLELMPIRYAAELSRILAKDFGVDSLETFRRAHGSTARDLSETKGYFFEGAPGPARSFHYAIVRDEAGGARPRAHRTAHAGPYTVAEYQPLIDYSTWRCADSPRDPDGRPAVEPAEWTPVELPTTILRPPTVYGLAPSREWRGPIVACRADMSVLGPGPLLVVVSLRAVSAGDRRVETFELNGVPSTASRLHAHSTLAALNLDVVFDVGDRLRVGTNTLALRIFSQPPQFDLDVYEIRR
jgi:hypothetical protein